LTQAQPVELPTAQTTPPKATPTAETPSWQTKALVSRKTGGRRPYAMKQVDVLAPVGPPGLGPPGPARLLALAQSPAATFDNFEDAPLSTLPGNLEDTPKSACQTVPSTDSVAIESRFGYAPEKPYTEYEITRDANTKSVAVFEDMENPSGDVNEQSVKTSGAGSLRKFARGSAIRKVQPAQLEGTMFCMLIWRIILKLRQMSKQTIMWDLLTPPTRLGLPGLALLQQRTRTSNQLSSVTFKTGSSTPRCSRKRHEVSTGRLYQPRPRHQLHKKLPVRHSLLRSKNGSQLEYSSTRITPFLVPWSSTKRLRPTT
jgi:hypothetical protein